MIFLTALLGALMNKIRGGLLTNLYASYLMRKDYEWEDAIEKAEKFLKPFSKQLHAIVFAFTFIYLVPTTLIIDWYDVVILYSAMFAGQSFGWGQYIEGMINKKMPTEPEIKIIDLVTIRNIKDPVLACCAALSLRGALWSFCVLVGLATVIMIDLDDPKNINLIFPTGFLMGPLYLLAMELCERLKGFTRGNGWQFGEYFTGFFFWGSWAYFLT